MSNLTILSKIDDSSSTNNNLKNTATNTTNNTMSLINNTPVPRKVGRKQKSHSPSTLLISTGGVSSPSFTVSPKSTATIKSLAASDSLDELSSRRARRYKPIDMAKELVILMPDDDPVQRLNVTHKDIPDLQICLDEVVEYEEDSDGDIQPLAHVSLSEKRKKEFALINTENDASHSLRKSDSEVHVPRVGITDLTDEAAAADDWDEQRHADNSSHKEVFQTDNHTMIRTDNSYHSNCSGDSGGIKSSSGSGGPHTLADLNLDSQKLTTYDAASTDKLFRPSLSAPSPVAVSGSGASGSGSGSVAGTVSKQQLRSSFPGYEEYDCDPDDIIFICLLNDIYHQTLAQQLLLQQQLQQQSSTLLAAVDSSSATVTVTVTVAPDSDRMGADTPTLQQTDNTTEHHVDSSNNSSSSNNSNTNSNNSNSRSGYVMAAYIFEQLVSSLEQQLEWQYASTDMRTKATASTAACQHLLEETHAWQAQVDDLLHRGLPAVTSATSHSASSTKHSAKLKLKQLLEAAANNDTSFGSGSGGGSSYMHMHASLSLLTTTANAAGAGGGSTSALQHGNNLSSNRSSSSLHSPASTTTTDGGGGGGGGATLSSLQRLTASTEDMYSELFNREAVMHNPYVPVSGARYRSLLTARGRPRGRLAASGGSGSGTNSALTTPRDTSHGSGSGNSTKPEGSSSSNISINGTSNSSRNRGSGSVVPSSPPSSPQGQVPLSGRKRRGRQPNQWTKRATLASTSADDDDDDDNDNDKDDDNVVVVDDDEHEHENNEETTTTTTTTDVNSDSNAATELIESTSVAAGVTTTVVNDPDSTTSGGAGGGNAKSGRDPSASTVATSLHQVDPAVSADSSSSTSSATGGSGSSGGSGSVANDTVVEPPSLAPAIVTAATVNSARSNKHSHTILSSSASSSSAIKNQTKIDKLQTLLPLSTATPWLVDLFVHYYYTDIADMRCSAASKKRSAAVDGLSRGPRHSHKPFGLDYLLKYATHHSHNHNLAAAVRNQHNDSSSSGGSGNAAAGASVHSVSAVAVATILASSSAYEKLSVRGLMTPALTALLTQFSVCMSDELSHSINSSNSNSSSGVYGTSPQQQQQCQYRQVLHEFIAALVYQYWLEKRSRRSTSLVRGYHRFTMRCWSRYPPRYPFPLFRAFHCPYGQCCQSRSSFSSCYSRSRNTKSSMDLVAHSPIPAPAAATTSALKPVQYSGRGRPPLALTRPDRLNLATPLTAVTTATALLPTYDANQLTASNTADATKRYYMEIKSKLHQLNRDLHQVKELNESMFRRDKMKLDWTRMTDYQQELLVSEEEFDELYSDTLTSSHAVNDNLRHGSYHVHSNYALDSHVTTSATHKSPKHARAIATEQQQPASSVTPKKIKVITVSSSSHGSGSGIYGKSHKFHGNQWTRVKVVEEATTKTAATTTATAVFTPKSGGSAHRSKVTTPSSAASDKVSTSKVIKYESKTPTWSTATATATPPVKNKVGRPSLASKLESRTPTSASAAVSTAESARLHSRLAVSSSHSHSQVMANASSSSSSLGADSSSGSGSGGSSVATGRSSTRDRGERGGGDTAAVTAVTSTPSPQQHQLLKTRQHNYSHVATPTTATTTNAVISTPNSSGSQLTPSTATATATAQLSTSKAKNTYSLEEVEKILVRYDEDRIILIGTAVFGVGKWKEIKQQFPNVLANISAGRMAGRFAHNLKRKLLKPSTIVGEEHSSLPDFANKVSARRINFSAMEINVLSTFDDTHAWDSLFIRHVLDALPSIPTRRKGDNVHNGDSSANSLNLKYTEVLNKMIPVYLQGGRHVDCLHMSLSMETLNMIPSLPYSASCSSTVAAVSAGAAATTTGTHNSLTTPTSTTTTTEGQDNATRPITTATTAAAAADGHVGENLKARLERKRKEGLQRSSADKTLLSPAAGGGGGGGTPVSSSEQHANTSAVLLTTPIPMDISGMSATTVGDATAIFTPTPSGAHSDSDVDLSSALEYSHPLLSVESTEPTADPDQSTNNLTPLTSQLTGATDTAVADTATTVTVTEVEPCDSDRETHSHKSKESKESSNSGSSSRSSSRHRPTIQLRLNEQLPPVVPAVVAQTPPVDASAGRARSSPHTHSPSHPSPISSIQLSTSSQPVTVKTHAISSNTTTTSTSNDSMSSGSNSKSHRTPSSTTMLNISAAATAASAVTAVTTASTSSKGGGYSGNKSNDKKRKRSSYVTKISDTTEEVNGVEVSDDISWSEDESRVSLLVPVKQKGLPVPSTNGSYTNAASLGEGSRRGRGNAAAVTEGHLSMSDCDTGTGAGDSGHYDDLFDHDSHSHHTGETQPRSQSQSHKQDLHSALHSHSHTHTAASSSDKKAGNAQHLSGGHTIPNPVIFAPNHTPTTGNKSAVSASAVSSAFGSKKRLSKMVAPCSLANVGARTSLLSSATSTTGGGSGVKSMLPSPVNAAAAAAAVIHTPFASSSAAATTVSKRRQSVTSNMANQSVSLTNHSSDTQYDNEDHDNDDDEDDEDDETPHQTKTRRRRSRRSNRVNYSDAFEDREEEQEEDEDEEDEEEEEEEEPRLLLTRSKRLNVSSSSSASARGTAGTGHREVSGSERRHHPAVIATTAAAVLPRKKSSHFSTSPSAAGVQGTSSTTTSLGNKRVRVSATAAAGTGSSPGYHNSGNKNKSMFTYNRNNRAQKFLKVRNGADQDDNEDEDDDNAESEDEDENLYNSD